MTKLEVDGKTERVEDPSALVLRALIKSADTRRTYPEIAHATGLDVETVVSAVAELAKKKHNIDVNAKGVEIVRDLHILTKEKVALPAGRTQHYRVGVTADNHLGSKYSRLDVIEALFDIWKEQGITKVYQLGNIIDGECRFNKFDLLVRGMEDQVDYLVENWPQRKGVVTEFITGDDHEGWYVQREGINIGAFIEYKAKKAGRNDLIYAGHMERQMAFVAGRHRSAISMIHAGGGTAYAISYTTQKLVESFQGGEKPAILLVGHYHKFEHGYPREVHTIQPGCTEDQTPFMRKKKIQAMVGGVTLEFDVNPIALVQNLRVTWHPFYDRDFSKGKEWKYRWK